MSRRACRPCARLMRLTQGPALDLYWLCRRCGDVRLADWVETVRVRRGVL